MEKLKTINQRICSTIAVKRVGDKLPSNYKFKGFWPSYGSLVQQKFYPKLLVKFSNIKIPVTHLSVFYITDQYSTIVGGPSI